MKGMRNVEENVNVKKRKKRVQFYKEIFIYLYLIKTLYVSFKKKKEKILIIFTVDSLAYVFSQNQSPYLMLF